MGSTKALYLLILLTFWGIFILIVPDHQQLGQTGHLGHLSDDPEEALHTVVGEDDGGEALRLWWDQREEERVAHTSPLLQEDRRWGVSEGAAAIRARAKHCYRGPLHPSDSNEMGQNT